MNGELAQVVALVAHGNLFLSGKDVDLSTNSTLQYVSSIKFVRYESNRDTQGMEVANSVPEWFSFLRSAKATRLWHIDFYQQRQDIPAHIASAFSGGVSRAIQADLPNGFELWYPQWETGGEDKYKPWLVEYRGLTSPNSYALPRQEMSAVKDRLRQAVLRAKDFAQGTHWTKDFARSLEALESSAPAFPFPDMLPSSGFPLEARQLLAAAAQAYVFGGMGSWNDMSLPNDPEVIAEYERISEELYEAIQFAIVMASNSFTA